MPLDVLVEQLKEHEGLRLEPYLDTEGKVTIGYGHNLTAHEGITRIEDARPITEEQAEQFLADDIAQAVSVVEEVMPEIWDLDEGRQAVLINMTFNLGTKLGEFKKMLKALKEGDFDQAAKEMLDSKWATQVKGRARELAKEMRDG